MILSLLNMRKCKLMSIGLSEHDIQKTFFRIDKSKIFKDFVIYS